MNAYQKAQALGITGKDAEIVAMLHASGLTARPIMLDDLLSVMNIPLKMLVRLPRADSDGSKWSGTAFNLIMYINATGTDEQKSTVNSWFSHITNDRNKTYDTTSIAFSSPLWAMRQAFGDQPGMPAIADFDTIADLGGGWLFADLTVEQFEAQRTASETEASQSQSASRKQAAISEANDVAVRAVADDSTISLATVISAFTARLTEAW